MRKSPPLNGSMPAMGHLEKGSTRGTATFAIGDSQGRRQEGRRHLFNRVGEFGHLHAFINLRF